MKVEGVVSVSDYYTFIYNRNTGKISSDSEADDGFVDFYNSEQKTEGEQDLGYTTRKAGIDSLIDFCSRQGVINNFFNSSDSNIESTIVVENTDSGAVRYYVDGKLLLTSMPGQFTSTVKLGEENAVNGGSDNEKTEFEDVLSFSISDIDDEENSGPQRKQGTFSQVITLPDGSRVLITTMYFCGKEIKITKKLPPIDENKNVEDNLLRQDNEDENVINIDVDEQEKNIKQNAENGLKEDSVSLLFEEDYFV